MSSIPIITLLTDFGTADGYVGAMKGVILNLNSRVKIVDITHDIPPQDIIGGALALSIAAPFYPKDTIHVAVVDLGVGSHRKPILMEWNGQYLIGPDNGLLTHAFSGSQPERVYHLNKAAFHLEHVSATFHGRDVFASVAGHLSKGVIPGDLGECLENWKKIVFPEPLVKENTIRGEVIHIDRFGNLITNIREEHLGYLKHFQDMRIHIREYIIKGIKRSYSDIEPLQLAGIMGSGGYLEISCNRGNAAETLKVKRGESVVLPYS